MKVICFDFDDVLINKNTLVRFLSLFSKKSIELEYELKILEDNRNPKKFFHDVTEGAWHFKGMPYEYVERVSKLIKLNKNGRTTLEKLKKKGYKIVIVSTTDEDMIKSFLRKNDLEKYIDHVYAAKIGRKNGLLTGKIYGDVIKTEKAGAIRRIEKLYKVKKKDIIYVGDGMTDLPIMKKVGRAILFCPNAITNAEVLADKVLMARQKQKEFFLIEQRDLSKILPYVF